MVRANEVFNEIMVLPPEKRNAILKTLGFNEKHLLPHPSCQHNSKCADFFCYVVEGLKYHCGYNTLLNFYLEYLDDKISDWRLNNDRIPKSTLAKEGLIAVFHNVQKDMLNIGWDGDYDQQPRVFFLPCPESESFELGFVWTQRRDGLTFIASPVPLSWLGEAKIKKGETR